MGWDPVFMVIQILVGAGLGFLSGLGVGGGSLLLLWLTQVQGVDQSQARLMNLLFFIPCALIATFLRRKEPQPDRSVTLTTIAAALVGAYLGNTLGGRMDTQMLKKAFGILFLLCGIRELRWKPEK